MGEPGSVPSQSAVFLVTLEKGHWASAQANQDGSFSATLLAPSGTFILIKVDPLGDNLPELFAGGPVSDRGELLISLPGTILRVPPGAAPEGSIPFGSAGLIDMKLPPAWTFQGVVDRQTIQPGGSLEIQGTLTIVSPALQDAGPMRAGVRIKLERLSGPDGTGTLAQNGFASAILTPTGLPIERRPEFSFRPPMQELNKVAPDRVEAVIKASLAIPDGFLAGFYRPLVCFSFDGVPKESPPSLPLFTRIDSIGRRGQVPACMHLPVLKVGNPAPPRFFWTLLTDTLSNGTRGVGAVEDRGHFRVSSRVLTQSQILIVPRVDAASGETYRLEPFALSVGVGDRGDPPNPPLIPFRFPSGSLTVRVRKPDGTVDVLGPASFVQFRVRGLGGPDLRGMEGGGYITDAYQLSTMDPRFEVEFTQDGRYLISLEGSIEDIWGNNWTGRGTYEVHVARTLSLDTTVFPGTPFEVGDVFHPGVTVDPPVAAEIEVHFRLAPNSEKDAMWERKILGRANRFGYFALPDQGISLERPGEYRVDVTARYRDDSGNLWMGSRTWGGVVAPRESSIVAHGRRGPDSAPTIGQQWFFRTQTGIPVGTDHINFAFNSGDVMWFQDSDSEVTAISFQDLTGKVVALLQERCCPGLTGPLASFEERVSVGEIPLFSSRADGLDPHLNPSEVDLWAYSYRSVGRPLVSVRELIGEEFVDVSYWRFNDRYADQIGAGANGDLPNDFKFQFGAAVVRGSALEEPQYGIYGSLFVLVLDDDPLGGTRIFPPFQGAAGGPSGGPIMNLKGRDIDIFFHPTGTRSGSILEGGGRGLLCRSHRASSALQGGDHRHRPQRQELRDPGPG